MRRLAAALPGLLALLLAVPADGKDIYKPYLDPAIAHHRAIIDTLKKLEAAPNDAELRNDLACLIAWDGFWRDALRELEKAAELAPKDSRPLFNAGLVRATRGEWRSARSEFRKATKRDPGNWPAWWMLGFSEEKLGNTRAAIEAYKVSLRVDTSLFSPRVNPFAASTQLKGRVLLETFDQRLARAAAPFANQITQPERLAPFFQVARPAPAPAAAAAAPAPVEEDPGKPGPVVTSVAPSSPGAPPAPRRSMESPTAGSGRTGVQLVPDAAARRRERRLSENPPDVPPAAPAGAVDQPSSGAAPGPGGGFPVSGTPPGTPQPAPPQQQPPPSAGPGGG